MTRQLRDYQLEACEKVTGAWGEGMLRPAIVLPTGTGKTDVIAKIATEAASDGRRVLALAHRGELLDQITERCKMHAPTIPVGRVQASRNEGRRPITVAMAPTLANEKRRARLIRPDLVIVDECHHAASPSQMAILQWAGSFDHTPTMGVTATMTRGDKRGLGDVWQDVVYKKSIKWAIDSGWLVKVRGRAVVVEHLKLETAKVTKGDYQDNELGEMVSQDVDQIVKAWLENASDRITVAFTPNVASAQALAEEFRAAGVLTGEVYGSTSRAERAEIYGDLGAGRIRVLVSVMVTTEGWDCPPVSCILMARPTRLPGLYQQIVGRGLRPDATAGKTDCLVLDVVGTSRGQRLVTLVDLHETAEYNTDELDALPCSECGGYTLGQVSEAFAIHGTELELCDCPPEEIGERDPDGGRIKLVGPAQYEEIDMFAASQLNWLFTRGGTRFLPAGDRMALLWPEGELYIAGHRTTRGYEDGRWIGPDGHWDPAGPLPLNEARQRAEAWALAVDPSVASRSSSWRKHGGPPSEAQINMARRCGVVNPESMNKSRLSDEISIALASRVLD
jgi:superfamily II DNA or RNA helicase